MSVFVTQCAADGCSRPHRAGWSRCVRHSTRCRLCLRARTSRANGLCVACERSETDLGPGLLPETARAPRPVVHIDGTRLTCLACGETTDDPRDLRGLTFRCARCGSGVEMVPLTAHQALAERVASGMATSYGVRRAA